MDWNNPTTTELLKHFLMCLRIHCASLSEMRVCSVAESTTQYFLRGVEGARNDCAISTVPITSVKDGQRLLLKESSKEPHVIPMEIKMVSPWLHKDHTVRWSCKFTRTQSATCEVVLISSILDPCFLAVIPMQYVRRRLHNFKRRRLEALGVQGARMLLAPSAFPAEWGPFLVPMLKWPSAQDSIRGYKDGSKDKW